MARILLIEDEVYVMEGVIATLKRHHTLTVKDKGSAALRELRTNGGSYDLVILDLMLPDISGEDVCKIIRKQARIPIIMLTAKVEEEDILRGLDIGADDYVIKPFSPKQLIARVVAVLRRTQENPVSLSNSISFNNGDIVIDNLKHEVKKDGNIINLTPNEYKILLTLIKRTFFILLSLLSIKIQVFILESIREYSIVH